MSEWIVTVTVQSSEGHKIKDHSEVRLTVERPEVEEIEVRTVSSEKPIIHIDDHGDRDLLTRLISKAAASADAGVLLQ